MRLLFTPLAVMLQREFNYYTTYENHQITAVDMNKEDLNAKKLIRFPLVCGEQIRWQN